MTVIITGLDELRRATRRWKDDFRPSSSRVRVLLRRVGRDVRDFARNKITTQGEGSWQPLSKWTRAKTGRRKALITLRDKIQYDVGADSVRVYDSDPRQLLAKHSSGYKNPPKQGPLAIGPLVKPGLLKHSGPYLWVRATREADVPRRNVWGTKRERTRVINPIVQDWVRDTIRRK